MHISAAAILDVPTEENIRPFFRTDEGSKRLKPF
jgi:hypothetical protein